MSNLTVQSLSAPAANGNKIHVPSPNVLYAPGHVIQVLQTCLTTPTAVSVPAGYAAYTNIPDLAATITPKSASSKIYVAVRWFGEFSNTGVVWDSMMGMKRNGTPVGLNPNGTGNAMGTAMPVLSYYVADANSTPEQCFFDFLDSPASLSPQTYQAFINVGTAITLYTNRTVAASTGGYEYGTSTMTLWEIAQ